MILLGKETRTGRYRSPAEPASPRAANRRRADRRPVTASFGSWRFIVGQSVVVVLWIGLNPRVFRVHHLALQYLFAWHRDAHGADSDCVGELGSAVDSTLARFPDDVIASEPGFVAADAR